MDKTRRGSKSKIARKSRAALVGPETKPVDKHRTAVAYPVTALLIFVVLGFLVYSNTLKSPFFLDDRAHIVENRRIRLTELDLKDIIAAGFESLSSTRPIANISFALNYYFHRYNVIGYHCTNICIHILAGIFLYFFVKNTLSIRLLRRRYHSCGRIAFFAALLWFVHPLQTQSVTYIVQRMNSMAAMFYILSLLLYVKGRLAVQEQRRSWPWFAGCMVAGLLSLGCKEMTATLPVFILLYEWYFFQDLSTTWLKRYLPYIVGVFIVFCLLGLWYLGSAPLQKILSTYDRRDFTLTERVLTQPRVVIYYVSLLAYPNPARLNLDHDFSLSYSLISPLTTLVCIAAIVGLIVLAVYIAKRERLLSFCILWFFGNLVIESSVIGLEIIFEHRVYLPSMLVVAAIVALTWRCIKQNWVKIPMFCILVLLCCIWTYERNSVWSDAVTLWKDCAAKSPGKARPQYNLATSLAEEGRNDEAIKYYTKTLQLDPNRSDAHLGFGVALLNEGKINQAIGHFTEALRLKPDYADAHINLGLAYSRQDRLESAIGCYYQALRTKPDSAAAYSHLGAALAAQGELDKAIACYRKALELKPDYVGAYTGLGSALYSQGKLDEAISYHRKALKIKPNSVEAYINLGAALAAQGKPEKAIECYREALRIKLDSAEAYINLGAALTAQGKSDEAIDCYREALKIKPDSAEAHNNLGNVLQSQGKLEEAIGHYRQALNIKPDSAVTLNGLAWLLATHAGSNVSEQNKAIRLAERASELTEHKNPAILDTLAAAYAAAGQFERAVATAEAALALASASKADELAGQIRERLELYRQERPYREHGQEQNEIRP